jgi:hypothetical protein
MNPTDATLVETENDADEMEPEAKGPVFQFSEDDLALMVAQLPPSARAREADCVALWRSLPQLLAEGHEGRVALIHEGKLVSVWDTYRDAMQAGYDKFGFDALLSSPKLTQRDLDSWKKSLTQLKAKQCPK